MKTFGWIVLSIIILFAVSVLATGGRIIGIAEDHVAHSVENAVVNYNDYQDIYATCNKINSDLGTLRSIPDNDPMFQYSSKNAMINNKKQQLTRWVQEYNAKSKHIDKKWWKSSELPQTLDENQFSNYSPVNK